MASMLVLALGNCIFVPQHTSDSPGFVLNGDMPMFPGSACGAKKLPLRLDGQSQNPAACVLY